MSKRPTTSKRLLMAIGAEVKLATGEIQTHGEEHLKEIPPDKKVIIATTHISDLDVPIATLKILGKRKRGEKLTKKDRLRFSESSRSYVGASGKWHERTDAGHSLCIW